MVKLTRDKRTGDYYTQDKRYMIEKCLNGWNIYELTQRVGYEEYKYSFSTDTLKEARESL